MPALTASLSSVEQVLILDCLGLLQQVPEEGVVALDRRPFLQERPEVPTERCVAGKERAQPLPSWTERGRKGIRMGQKVRQPADKNNQVTFSTWQMPHFLGYPLHDLRVGVSSLRKCASAPVVGGR